MTLAGSDKGDVEEAEGEYDKPEAEVQGVGGQEQEAGRDEWLTENSGRNILTGQLPQTQAAGEQPKPSGPKISVSAFVISSLVSSMDLAS